MFWDGVRLSWEDTTPIRLNQLLSRDNTCLVHANLDKRLDLAKILMASIQSFHASGWVHKNISSFNVLMVGFDYSRKDDDEYT